GTSASEGIVSAVIGLVLAVDNSLTAEEIYELVRKSVDPAVSEPDRPIPGRINAQKAVKGARGEIFLEECPSGVGPEKNCTGHTGSCCDSINNKKYYCDPTDKKWIDIGKCQEATPPPECTPGQKMTQLCWTTDEKPGQQERTCGSDGKWGAWGECKEVGAPPSKKPNGSQCSNDSECESGYCWDHDKDGVNTCQANPPPSGPCPEAEHPCNPERVKAQCAIFCNGADNVEVSGCDSRDCPYCTCKSQASPSASPSPGQCGGGGSPSPGTSPSPGSQGLPKGSPCFSDGMCASGSCNCTKMPNTNICQGIGTCN
ncbi:MAG: hypothetical protein NC920_02340, partial [Candidatus Omnitrophica bacterium]|nr:hypothetical protein [Candidatus Omnitrophota bacterium]